MKRNLLLESTVIGLISAIIGFIYIKIMNETPYKTYIPCVFYIIGFMIYFLYHIKDFRSLYCITGLCNEKIGNIVIYDDNNIVESFIESKTFTDKKEGYVFKTDKMGTGYYEDN